MLPDSRGIRDVVLKPPFDKPYPLDEQMPQPQLELQALQMKKEWASIFETGMNEWDSSNVEKPTNSNIERHQPKEAQHCFLPTQNSCVRIDAGVQDAMLTLTA